MNQEIVNLIQDKIFMFLQYKKKFTSKSLGTMIVFYPVLFGVSSLIYPYTENIFYALLLWFFSVGCYLKNSMLGVFRLKYKILDYYMGSKFVFFIFLSIWVVNNPSIFDVYEIITLMFVSINFFIFIKIIKHDVLLFAGWENVQHW